MARISGGIGLVEQDSSENCKHDQGRFQDVLFTTTYTRCNVCGEVLKSSDEEKD